MSLLLMKTRTEASSWLQVSTKLHFVYPFSEAFETYRFFYHLQRLLLEVGFEALHNAGYSKESLLGSMNIFCRYSWTVSDRENSMYVF